MSTKSELQVGLVYVNIGVPCESQMCKTNKSTWFILQINSVSLPTCDDCIYEIDKGMEWTLYKSMVDYTKEMEFDWPSDWIPIEQRIGDYA